MPDLTLWILPATAALALLGVGGVVWLAMYLRCRASAPVRSSAKVVAMACTVCREDLLFPTEDLVPLSPPEQALAVRVQPDVLGKRLAEYVCPHCEAAHCFATKGRRVEWIGVNLYEPQTKSAHCVQCKVLLRAPDWAPGRYDGRLHKAPGLEPDHGLVCPLCGAVCCVRCCRDATRNRTEDGSLKCPRCSRHPVDKVYHS